jgi:hypothetical protein
VQQEFFIAASIILNCPPIVSRIVLPNCLSGMVFVTQLCNTVNMNRSLSEIDVDILKAMYETESVRLRQALLEGASWDELMDQRKYVTDLAVAIDNRKHSDANPAESSRRKNLG